MVIMVIVIIAAPTLRILRGVLRDRLEVVVCDRITSTFGLSDKLKRFPELFLWSEINFKLDITIDTLLVEKHVIHFVARRFFVCILL